MATDQKPPYPRDDQRTDLELVAAANGGEVEAFEALYRRYNDWVVSLAYRYTRDRELALDVLQETFLYVLGKFPGFELRSEMKTFLYPTVRHLSVALQSKATRRPPLSGSLKFQPPHDPGYDERLRGLAEIMDTSFVAVDSLTRTAGAYGTSVNVPVPVADGMRYETTVAK